MRPAPAVALVLGYGAGLATGLLRFGDAESAFVLLVVLALALQRRPIVALILGAACVGRGVAWVQVKARANVKAFPNGISELFQFVFVVDGASLYDRRQAWRPRGVHAWRRSGRPPAASVCAGPPRLRSSTWAWPRTKHEVDLGESD